MIYRENNYEIIYSQNDLPGSIKPRIIKLHGSIPQVKPYIISDEDYRTYPDKYSALVNTVQQAMLELGYAYLDFPGMTLISKVGLVGYETIWVNTVQRFI